MALYLPYHATPTGHLSASRTSRPSPSSCALPSATPVLGLRLCHPSRSLVRALGNEDIELRVSGREEEKRRQREQEEDANPEDLECVEVIQRVVELLKKNRDMTFGEVKLTILIEDPRDIERKRLLGVDPDDITREDLVAALEDVCDSSL